MFEIILYAAIAITICVIFYSVLGKDMGQGSDNAFNLDQFDEKPKQNEADIVAPINEETVIAPSEITPILKADPNFIKREFIEGARMAYPMILEAYATGNKETLKELLTSDVYVIYSQAITEREAASQTQVSDLGRLYDARITGSEVDGSVGSISVEYEADIASAVLDDESNVLQGDPNMLIRIKEIWTFTRDLKSSDPNWRLSDVAPSTGGELEADPTPDTNG